jgi:hypothetical protein
LKFNLSCAVTVSAYTIVEAETLAEAIVIAERRDVLIGGNNSGTSPEESWIIEEADGAPQNINGDAE